MENRLVVKDANGKEETIDVIDIVLDNETQKRYVFYHLIDDESVYASILRETDSVFFLEAITDDAEWDLVEEILKNILKVEGVSNESE